MSANYIKRVEINKLWGKHDIVWDKLNPDVNILVGINGSGKSTLLRVIYAAIARDEKSIAQCKFESAKIENQNNWHEIKTTSKNKKSISGGGYEDEFIENCEFISTFDVPTNKSKLKTDESPLLLELRNLISIAGTNSFTDYRLKATHSAELAIEVNKRIDSLFKIINHFFEDTGKTIEIDFSNNIVFATEYDFIGLEQLSAGEKQLLFILLKVFLMEEKASVLIMDEPEISMHLIWQQDLIQTIRTLNPNIQLIISTHSPSIYSKGWGNRITFMEKLFVE